MIKIADLGGETCLLSKHLRQGENFVWSAYNPCVALDMSGKLYVSIQSSNFRRTLEGQVKVMDGGDTLLYETWIGELTPSFSLINLRQLDWRGVSKEEFGHPEIRNGLQNTRMYQSHIGWWSFASTLQENEVPVARNVVLGLVPDQSRILGLEVSPERDKNTEERDWMPVHRVDTSFDFLCDPYTVYRSIDKTFAKVQPQVDIPRLRGGSQLISYGENLIGVMREMVNDKEYNHYITVVNHAGEITKISKPFQFFGGIEFCLGIADIGDNFLFSFGKNEEEAWIAALPKNVVNALVS
jgi:hypothetical protein